MRFFVGTGTRDVISKETGPKARQTLTIPRHSDPVKEDRAMPFGINITARGDSASTQDSQNWESIGELARKLAEKLGRAS